MKITDVEKRAAFQPSGVKSHHLYQATSAILLITELPSKIIYTLDYFQWHTIMKSLFIPTVLTNIVLTLSNAEEVIIDYEEKTFYRRKVTNPTTSSMVATHLNEIYTYGLLVEED